MERNNKNSWKSESENYLEELEIFLDKIENIEDKNLRREILTTALRIDNELTILSEKLFKKYYAKGYEDGKKNISRIIYRNN